MPSLTPPRNGIPIALVSINGREYEAQIHPEWMRYLANGLFDRAGGVAGASTTDLLASAFEDAGIEEAKAGLYRLDQDIGQMPQFVQQLQDDVSSLGVVVSELRERIAVLQTELEGMRQGILI